MIITKDQRLQLQKDFENEEKVNCINSQGEVDLDYILWLKEKFIRLQKGNK